MKKVDLVYFNAGGGHRASAMALQQVIRDQQRPWDVRLVNLSEVLDSDGSVRRLMGFDPEAFYNRRLARGWTLGLAQELKLLQGLIRLCHPMLRRTLDQHWLRTEPDLVVSLVPNFNRALCESVGATLPGVPFVTVMTDMADLPPHFWIEPGHAQHVVCGTPHAAAQARAAGVDGHRIWPTSGMMLRPSFYRALGMDRGAALRAQGLDPAQPTGVVMFGGQGSMQMVRIAKLLGDVQLIFLCGHNEALAAKLRVMRRQAAHVVIGYTPDIARCLKLGDFFIGKPGPGCLSEALHMGLPVITFENAWTMPQERYNTRWVRDAGVGIVLKSVQSLAPAVADLALRLPDIQTRVRRLRNRAIFEVPEILAHLMDAPSVSTVPDWPARLSTAPA